MLNNNSSQSFETELFINIEDLVPEDHLLVKVCKHIDFNFIYDKVCHLYSQTGRPSVDPVVMFKMLFIGYLFGIRSERQLVKEIQVNVAYRWFLGFGLRDEVPHHSTISQNRRRRFSDSTIYQDIFDEIVYQAIRRNMVDGETLYTDSTHLKADANKNKHTRTIAESSTRSYLDALDRDINKDRDENGKPPLPPSKKERKEKEVKTSTTDPDSGYMVRDGKPKGFFYLDHRTTDSKCNIITDTYVTAGNVHDSIPYLERLDYQRVKFGFYVSAVGLDAGYFTAPICKGLQDRDIFGVFPYKRKPHRKGYFYQRDYVYDSEDNVYVCPNNKKLKYRTTNRNGYKEYVSDSSECSVCIHLSHCTSSRQKVKVLTRHVWQDSVEAMDAHRFTDYGKSVYSRRKETIERSFADAKQLHNHRYARMRGIKKVSEQCLLAAACQNMKKIALLLSFMRRYFSWKCQIRLIYRPYALFCA